jgi:hypothetical protein
MRWLLDQTLGRAVVWAGHRVMSRYAASRP